MARAKCPAHKIEAEITYARVFFGLPIRDDGKGIDPRSLKRDGDGHCGLAGMRERAELIGTIGIPRARRSKSPMKRGREGLRTIGGGNFVL